MSSVIQGFDGGQISTSCKNNDNPSRPNHHGRGEPAEDVTQISPHETSTFYPSPDPHNGIQKRRYQVINGQNYNTGMVHTNALWADFD